MLAQFFERQCGEVVVIDGKGRVTNGEGALELGRTLRTLLARGEKKVLFSVAEISWFDSSGIGELVAGGVSIINADGVFKLLRPSERVHQRLLGAKLIGVFDIYEDEARALASFE